MAVEVISLLSWSATVLPGCFSSTTLTCKRNEFLELLLGVSFEKWGNANGKIQHFPLTSPLSFELKCI